MAKAKASQADNQNESAAELANSQLAELMNPEMYATLQQETLKGIYQMMELSMQNTMATQQLMQDSLGMMSGLYKSYFGSINGATQHSWATYSSIWNDPWGLSKDQDSA